MSQDGERGRFDPPAAGFDATPHVFRPEVFGPDEPVGPSGEPSPRQHVRPEAGFGDRPGPHDLVQTRRHSPPPPYPAHPAAPRLTPVYGAQPQPFNPMTAQQATAIAVLGRKSPGVAALLSVLIVGLGQVYCGRVGRGFAFFGAAVVSGLLTVVLVGFLLVPVVFIWALVDAVCLANRQNALLAHQLVTPPPSAPPGWR